MVHVVLPAVFLHWITTISSRIYLLRERSNTVMLFRTPVLLTPNAHADTHTHAHTHTHTLVRSCCLTRKLARVEDDEGPVAVTLHPGPPGRSAGTSIGTQCA
jgi:hypothetical protein